MKPTSRDAALLRHLERGNCPRGSHNDVERLNTLLGEHCVNRAHPLYEYPYLFLERHHDATTPPLEVVRSWLEAQPTQSKDDE